MPLITAITAAPRHPGRFEIVVDGQRIALLPLEAIERLELSVGKSVDGLEVRLAVEDARQRAYHRALDMLALRARSSAELRRSLVRKGEPREHVEWAVARLMEQGLLDDAAFAQSFIRARVVGAGHSRRRVQRDLARKGVARAVSDAAIATVFADEQVDQRSIVEAAARKKLRGLSALEPLVRRRRLYAFLARRGYDADDIRAAMQAVGQDPRTHDG